MNTTKKSLTQEGILEWYKSVISTDLYSESSYEVSRKTLIKFIKNKKGLPEKYTVKIVTFDSKLQSEFVKNQEVITNSSNNYTQLVNETFILLYKYKLIINVSGITLVSEISSFDSENIGSFLFDETESIESQELITSEEEFDITYNDTLTKIIISNDTMSIYTSSGDILNRVYNRNNVINLIGNYISKKVEDKKKDKKTISSKISLYYTSKSQNLLLSESQVEEKTEKITTQFIDSTMTNDYFVLCSLSDLTVNKVNLDRWIQKTLINTQKISKIYFN